MKTNQMCNPKQSLTYEWKYKASCNVEKLTTLLKEAPSFSGFLAVTSCLPSPSLNWLTNEIPSLTHLTNELWRMDRRCCICRMGKASAVLVLVGVVLTVFGSTVQVSLQPTSAHRLLTSACMCVFDLKWSSLSMLLLLCTTSDVFVNGSQMTALLFLIRKCVLCEQWETPCNNGYSLIRQHSHTVVIWCCFSRLDVKYWHVISKCLYIWLLVTCSVIFVVNVQLFWCFLLLRLEGAVW